MIITTDEQFLLAASVWIPANPQAFQGASFVDATGRRIFDERPNPVDVTPESAVLEAALDTALAAIADEDSISASSNIMLTARRYLRNQLRSANPDITTIFNTIKTSVDGNPALLTMLNNNITLMALAYGWNAANVRNATAASTNAVKAQYIEAAKSIVALFA